MASLPGEHCAPSLTISLQCARVHLLRHPKPRLQKGRSAKRRFALKRPTLGHRRRLREPRYRLLFSPTGTLGNQPFNSVM